jgi:tRNA threonylcarbamoyladenosine biosynthesis protein TsaE
LIPSGIFTTRSEEETFQLGRDLARVFQGAETVLLVGNLGAGKTVFAKGIAAGLEIDEESGVCSPTYTLINIHQGRCSFYHIDLYRLEGAEEIADLGWEDFIGRAVVVIEWAEKLPFPIEGIRVTIEVEENDTRRISIES